MIDRNKKPSHIIVNVDKNVSEDSFRAFCTNIMSEDPQIRFTYLSYDNQIPDERDDTLCKVINKGSENTDQMLIITDSENAALYAGRTGVATAVLLTDRNRDRDFSFVTYCIEDIEYISFERINRIWQRHLGIPWTIAETERLVIREQTLDDLDALYEVYSDKDATRYMEDLYEDRDEEAEYLREYIDNQYKFYEYGIWAVILKENNKLIGRAGISSREGYDLPEIGYIIGREYRRCGYAKEACKAIIRYGQNELGFTEFMAFSKAKNTASANLLKSLGFMLSGRAVITGGEHTMYILTKTQ